MQIAAVEWGWRGNRKGILEFGFWGQGWQETLKPVRPVLLHSFNLVEAEVL